MTPGGCPTATTCAWVASGDDARWQVCRVCEIERVTPGVDPVVLLDSVDVRPAVDRLRELAADFAQATETAFPEALAKYQKAAETAVQPFCRTFGPIATDSARATDDETPAGGSEGR